MATYHETVTPEQAQLIERAALFFIASVDPALERGPHGVGPLNLSPKGGVKLHVLAPDRLAYADFKGSGDETVRHSGGPVTVMVCSFEEADAAIVRVYGKARAIPIASHPEAERLFDQATIGSIFKPRQVIEISVESSMTSCGYGVPVMELKRERSREDLGKRYKQ